MTGSIAGVAAKRLATNIANLQHCEQCLLLRHAIELIIGLLAQVQILKGLCASQAEASARVLHQSRDADFNRAAQVKGDPTRRCHCGCHGVPGPSPSPRHKP